MSIILICRRILDGNIKPKVANIVSSFKLHTISRPKTPILKTNKASIVTKRSFLRFFKKPKKGELKIIDNIPDHYDLIYRNTMQRYILMAQWGTSIMSVIMFFVVIIICTSPKNQFRFRDEPDNPLKSTETQIQIYFTVFVIAIVVLQMVITKMPLRIYYLSEQKKYIMILPTNIPLSNKRLIYTVGDLEKLPLTGILPWKDARYRVKEEKDVLLLEEHFRRPADLYIMLGVQRDPEDKDE